MGCLIFAVAERSAAFVHGLQIWSVLLCTRIGWVARGGIPFWSIPAARISATDESAAEAKRCWWPEKSLIAASVASLACPRLWYWSRPRRDAMINRAVSGSIVFVLDSAVVEETCESKMYKSPFSADPAWARQARAGSSAPNESLMVDLDCVVFYE